MREVIRRLAIPPRIGNVERVSVGGQAVDVYCFCLLATFAFIPYGIIVSLGRQNSISVSRDTGRRVVECVTDPKKCSLDYSQAEVSL